MVSDQLLATSHFLVHAGLVAMISSLEIISYDILIRAVSKDS